MYADKISENVYPVESWMLSLLFLENW